MGGRQQHMNDLPIPVEYILNPLCILFSKDIPQNTVGQIAYSALKISTKYQI
jgi:hypothetical protein